MKGSAHVCNEYDEASGTPVVTQSSHGFAVGDILYESTDGVYAKARADAEATFTRDLGICAHVTDSNTFVLWRRSFTGPLAWTHGKGTPTFGEDLYLSDSTAGDTATTPGAFSVRVGYIRDVDNFQWDARPIA